MGKKLYRYRAFDNSAESGTERWKNEIFKGFVYPSSPISFNDPYDCDCADVVNVVDRNIYISILKKHFPLKSEEKEKILHTEDVRPVLQKIVKKYGGRLSHNWENIIQEALSLSGGNDKIKNLVRILCFSEKKDSILMWSHYANSHKGYCIEYEFNVAERIYPLIHSVKYAKERYAISAQDLSDNTKGLIEAICHKAEDWSYECEWRMVIPYTKIEIIEWLYKNGMPFGFSLKENMKSIYLGAKCDGELKDEVVYFGKEQGIKVYQMELSSDTYKLNAKKVI